jgi:hypothetical protein
MEVKRMLPEIAAENWNEGASIRLRGADWRTAVFGRKLQNIGHEASRKSVFDRRISEYLTITAAECNTGQKNGHGRNIRNLRIFVQL